MILLRLQAIPDHRFAVGFWTAKILHVIMTDLSQLGHILSADKRRFIADKMQAKGGVALNFTKPHFCPSRCTSEIIFQRSEKGGTTLLYNRAFGTRY